MPEETTFDLSGGRLCLDFANTQHNRDRADGQEDLNSYPDLVAFGRQASVLTPEAARRLMAVARREPKRAAAAFGRAVELRESAYRVFSRIGRDEEAAREDLEGLRTAAAAALGHARLVRTDGGYEWRIPSDTLELDAVTWAAALSAERLLTEHDRPAIGECSGDTCTWLFLDLSRNRSRRWCSMKDCGNRAKAKRHYQKVRTAAKRD